MKATVKAKINIQKLTLLAFSSSRKEDRKFFLPSPLASVFSWGMKLLCIGLHSPIVKNLVKNRKYFYFFVSYKKFSFLSFFLL